MSAVRVVCAPGCHFTLAPHPSGVAGLAPLVLHDGDATYVTEARSAELWRARLIRHPLTGEVPPPPIACRLPGVVKMGGPSRAVVVMGHETRISLWEPEDAASPATTERNRAPTRVVAELRPVSPGVAITTMSEALRGSVRIDDYTDL